mgnify:CR=1 FL=1
MENSKLETITNLFEGSKIRSIWNNDKEEYYFSIIDVIGALTESNDPSHYWRTLKSRMIKEGNETVTNCDTFKLKAKDGKLRNTDMLDTKGIFRLIESVPSPKAEPMKMWLANLGKERIDEVFDPEIAGNRIINYYRNNGYSDEWIKKRLTGMVDRFKLTDVWKDGGIEKPAHYAILTNEIYKSWSGMKASEYKAYKGIRKESLRDNMTDIEVLLTDLGEIATRDIAKSLHPQGFKENMEIARKSGQVADDARKSYEKATNKSAVSNKNSLNYQYIDDIKLIDNNHQNLRKLVRH